MRSIPQSAQLQPPAAESSWQAAVEAAVENGLEQSRQLQLCRLTIDNVYVCSEVNCCVSDTHTGVFQRCIDASLKMLVPAVRPFAAMPVTCKEM